MSKWTKGDLQVGYSLNQPANLPVGADGTALVADSTLPLGVKWQQRSRSIADVSATATVVSSTSDTTLATLAVPTTVAAGDVLELVVAGDQLNNIGSNANYTYKIKLGATTMLATNALATSTNANRRAFHCRALIDVIVAASDQRITATMIQGGATAGAIAFGATVAAGRGTAAEDLTAGKNLLFTVTLGTSDATIDFRLQEAVLLVHKR